MRRGILSLMLVLGLIVTLALPPGALLAADVETQAMVWQVGLAATDGDVTATTIWARAFPEGEATEGYDDGLEIPSPGPNPAPFVYAYFPHKNTDAHPFDPPEDTDYLTDARPEADVITWDFEVVANSAREITVTWDLSGAGVGSYELVDVTADPDVVIDMKSVSEYTQTFIFRQFQVIYVADADPPPVPTLLSPASGSAGQVLPIILDWETVTDPGDMSPPVTYDLQVAYNAIFLPASLVVNETDLTDSTFTLTGPLPYSGYNWRVRASDSAGNRSAWSSAWNFTLAPGGITWSAELTASATSGGSELGDAGVAGVAPDAAVQYDAYDVIKAPFPPTPYVQVSFDHSDWTYRPDLYETDVRPEALVVTWDFMVMTSFSGAVTLGWDVSAIPSLYAIEIRDAGTPVAYPRLQTSYGYSATANVPEVLTLWVGLDTIAPGAPTLVSPANGSYEPEGAPVFDWENVFDPSGVTYLLHVETAGEAAIHADGLTASTYTPAEALDDGVYNWWVQATDGAGNTGAASATWTFTVDTESPVITDAVAAPAEVSLFGMVPGSTPFSPGSYTTTLVVEADDTSPIDSVTADLKTFVLALLPSDIDERVAQLPPGFPDAWDAWLSDLEATDFVKDPGTGLWLLGLDLKDVFAALYLFFGSDVDDIFAEELRLGSHSIPVTVTDAAGTAPATGEVELLVVDIQRPIERGWNLISTPVSLADANWSSVASTGGSLEYDAALRYNAEAQRWEQYASTPSPGWYYGGTKVADGELQPLDALYVHGTGSDQLNLVVSRGNSAPPARTLYAGWNLASLASLEPAMPVEEALVSVQTAPGDLTGYTQVLSPSQNVSFSESYVYDTLDLGGYDWVFNQAAWVYTVWAWGGPDMATGGAYWVFMEHDDTLGGFSYTPVALPLAGEFGP